MLKNVFLLFRVYYYISIQKMNSHLHVECIACLQVWKLCVRKNIIITVITSFSFPYVLCINKLPK